ncbi:MAG: hypothetical protein DRJ40_02900 [Thermoprotei archaeon]|nr:MAG: hypothetical protein DRJ40_02900 [Thermoprotei archaeon]
MALTEVEDCLQRPDAVLSEDEVKKAVKIKKLDDKVLVVVYRVLNNKILVITVYKSSRVRKYFQVPGV